jgi:cytochrome P450
MTGLPHLTKEDDVVDGYFIPKGSKVYANLWLVSSPFGRISVESLHARKMARDPNVYKDPSRFNPSRFLSLEPELDPREYCFGFGTRACPGMVVL